MAFSVEQIAAEIEVSQVELRRWIGEQWVLPAERDGAFLFDEVDRARVLLIAELRRDMAVNDEAVPVILQLLDQVYELRRALGDLTTAIQQLPDDTRGEIDRLMREP